jgi:hypothetical protein
MLLHPHHGAAGGELVDATSRVNANVDRKSFGGAEMNMLFKLLQGDAVMDAWCPTPPHRP